MTSKYTRKITKVPVSVTPVSATGDGGNVTVELDVYDVLAAWEVTNPAIQHAIKKLLMPGARGAKSKVQDIEEALSSIKRALELEGGELTEITQEAMSKMRGSHGSDDEKYPGIPPEMRQKMRPRCVDVQFSDGESKLPAIDPSKLPPMPPVKKPRIATPREIVGSLIGGDSPRAEKLMGLKAILADSRKFGPWCRDDADALELAAYYISQTELRGA